VNDKNETIVLIEHDSRGVKASSLHAITLAQQLGEYSLLILGHSLNKIATTLSSFDAKCVLVVDDMALAHPLSDKYASAIASVARIHGINTILASSSAFTKDILPRVAALIDAVMLTDVIGIEKRDNHVVYRRPLYAGNALGTIELNGNVHIITIRDFAFQLPENSKSNCPVEFISIEAESLPTATEFVSREDRKSERPDLTEARIVVSGGRPLKDRKTFDRLIGALADILSGAVGATRAAVDSGIAPNNWQIGQTGKIIAPNLYIAIGISGAIQHLAGIRDSKVIVAINKDPDTPIFQVATYGLVGDLYEIVPKLIEAIHSH
jgi:electron transfer flavoprotein alpha subunit